MELSNMAAAARGANGAAQVAANREEVKFVPYKKPYEEFCPDCNRTVTTKTSKVCGMLNFVLFIACLFLPCLVCCFWLPCFMDVEHSCPDCKKPLAKADRI